MEVVSILHFYKGQQAFCWLKKILLILGFYSYCQQLYSVRQQLSKEFGQVVTKYK